MRTKAYFITPESETGSIAKSCVDARIEWHGHTIPPGHTNMLIVVVNPPAAMELGFAKKYIALPDMHDNSETISQKHIDLFPQKCGLTTSDTAYLAIKKISTALGMAAMNPKG